MGWRVLPVVEIRESEYAPEERIYVRQVDYTLRPPLSLRIAFVQEEAIPASLFR